MGNVDLLQLAAQFGISAPLIFYLIWREAADRKERKDQAAARAEIEEREIQSREKLATSLAALSIAITGKPHV